MILFWLLCASLTLGGLALHREVRSALEDLWLFAFAARARVQRPARRTVTGPFPAPPPPLRLPPPRVITRAGP
jgi:hypothetical protein